MKYDCSKTLDYSHERRRMCDSFCDQKGIRLCFKCPLQELYCTHVCRITPDHIDIVQTWSDTHPEKTRLEAFLEIFPKAKAGNIITEVCFNSVIGVYSCDEPYGITNSEYEKCFDCWNKPYSGEFEEEASE